ncbi:MAG: hypothetical protein F6K40_04655 [Okeania sp. SIO3I5]|uniref:SPFH domain-containing protein n=1 Tax=Okeania sp. SIO3I5 TaxID=2607805 RepID=UPI0013B6132C|nr:SPFH domain-containing protein [Okeania sp. SIO3I5]NEQ35626.1 hypothetical protein [Okeania sp. SIO3I5]
MKKRVILAKAAILLTIANIGSLSLVNKSKTQALAEESNQVFINENFSPSKLSSTNLSTLTTQQVRNSLNNQSPPVVLAQVSGGVGAIIFVLILIVGTAIVIFIFMTRKMIGNDEVGIVYKKFALNPFLSLLPGKTIALNGEPGIQAKVLSPGLHWGYFPWMYEITKEKVTRIGEGKIGLVEALDGQPLQVGQNSGKAVECNNFLDVRAFFDNGGQRGKQRAILTTGTYRINTKMFLVKQVPVTEISPNEIGLVEALDGSPLIGQSFAQRVNCKDFQDAQAFFDNGGQAGQQLAHLTVKKYQINIDIFRVKKVSITTINAGEIGLVEAKYGKPLAQGKNFAEKVNCDNFQNAQAFFENGGQAGKQLATLEPGNYDINTEIFKIRKVSIISIPPGEIGLVIANDGIYISTEQILGKVVECDNFQDAEAFIKNGGQKGKQPAILTEGQHKIHTDFFTVITTANAHEYNEHPKNLKVCKINKGQIGIVTTMAGQTLPKEEIAGQEIEGHDNYQNAQKFLDSGGYKGLQEEVLKEGEWKLNPWFVTVEQIPVTEIEQEEVGVVISSVGKKYDIHDDDPSSSQYQQLVDPGYKGVENKPLTANTYPINTRVKQVKRVPSTQIILNWSDKEKNPFSYDYELKTMKLTSSDGYKISVEFTQIIRILPENAPKMICLFGSKEDKIPFINQFGEKIFTYPAVKNLVSRVLTKVVSGYFKQAATGKTAIEFQNGRASCQEEAEVYINSRLADIGVEGCGTVIDEIDLPKELDEHRQRLEKQKQEKKEAQAKTEAEKQRQELAKAEKDRQEFELVRDAEINNKLSQMDTQAKLQKEQSELEIYQKRLDIETSQQEKINRIELDALRARITALSPELYAQLESQGKWADALAQMKITFPQIMMTGGNSGSGDSANLFNLLEIEHLTGLADRLQLNQGTSTPSLSMPATKTSLPPN